MPRNQYFSLGATSEKNLYEDIIIEGLRIYGHDVYYLPRKIINEDAVFNEALLSEFGEAFQIEMYVETIDGFGGEGDILSKFGLEMRDQMKLVVSNKRWEQLVGRFQPEVEVRPQEGDLIYFPLVKGLFQIHYVEEETPFYQLQNIPTFTLNCELFEYSNEQIDTGIEDIDSFEKDFASRITLTLGEGTGNFQIGEDVTQINATTGITISGEVATTPIAENPNWLQLGQDIDGEATNDRSGWSVSINGEGDRVAIGATGNAGNGPSSGHTRIYEYSNETWSQLGQDIDGEADGDLSGYSVSMNSTGDRVAIGATFNDGNGIWSGHTRIYKFDGINWIQLGFDIDGEAADDRSGYSVSINSTGDRVAIGAFLNDGNGINSGHTRIYEWREYTAEDVGLYHHTSRVQDNTQTKPLIITQDFTVPVIGDYYWTQLGSDIDGETINDVSGHSVSINAAGDRIAIGAINNDDNGTSSGHTRIYEYNVSTQAWEQLGQDIDGEAAYDLSGESVSMNDAGNRVAIGAVGSYEIPGYTRIYEFNGANWTQLGQDIDGEAADDKSGHSVSINAAGDRVAIGARFNDDNGNNSGHTRIYEFNGTNWVQLSYDIDGEASDDQSGYSVSINAAGDRVAIGAIFSNDNNSGHARIYEYGISGYNSGATIEIYSQEASDGSNTLFAPTSGNAPGNIIGSKSGASYEILSRDSDFKNIGDIDPFADNEEIETFVREGNFIDFSETNPFGIPDITV